MRKKIFGRKFSRDTDSRKALMRSLVRAFVLSGKIRTTKAKGKLLQREIDKLMNLVAKNTLNSRRLVMARTGNDKDVTRRLFEDFLELAKSRVSGFTKLVNLSPRKGDMAKMVRLEWVEKKVKK